MIFVSVGTQETPFNRLLKAVDEIADVVGEKILAQTGFSTYRPQKCEFFRFCDYEGMLSHIRAASMVISHSGFGIIGNTIKSGKPMILVPRELRYGEGVDKQYELAEYMASQYKSIKCVRDTSLLATAVKEIREVHVHYNYNTTIPALIDKFISGNFFTGA